MQEDGNDSLDVDDLLSGEDESNDIDRDDDEEDLLIDENNIFDEPYIDMFEFISVVDQDMVRDPNSIPIEEPHMNMDDELLVIDTEVFDTVGEESEERRKLLEAYAKPIRCSEDEIHITAFKLGQKFKSKADVTELVGLHSIHTRRA